MRGRVTARVAEAKRALTNQIRRDEYEISHPGSRPRGPRRPRL
jgi:hypothetical protein